MDLIINNNQKYLKIRFDYGDLKDVKHTECFFRIIFCVLFSLRSYY